MKVSRALVERIMAIILLFILLGVTFYIPAVSAVSVWLIPFPLMYGVSKFGWQFGIVELLIGLAFMFLSRLGLYLLFPFFFTVMGFSMGTMIRLKKPAFAILLAGSLANITILTLYLAGSVLIYGFNPVAEGKKAIWKSVETMLAQAGPLLHQNTETLADLYQNYINYLGVLAPSLIVVVGVINSLIVAIISLPLLRRFGVEAPEWVPFKRWRVPKSVIWIYLIALLLIQTGIAGSETPLFTISVNFSFVMQLLLAIQGLSFIFFFAALRHFPGIIPIMIAVAVVIFSVLLLQLVTLLGIIDLGFDLRKRLAKKN